MPLIVFNPWTEHISGATIPGQSGPGSDGNKGVLRIPQSSRIAGTSPSENLVSYQDTHWGGSYIWNVLYGISSQWNANINLTRAEESIILH